MLSWCRPACYCPASRWNTLRLLWKWSQSQKSSLTTKKKGLSWKSQFWEPLDQLQNSKAHDTKKWKTHAQCEIALKYPFRDPPRNTPLSYFGNIFLVFWSFAVEESGCRAGILVLVRGFWGFLLCSWLVGSELRFLCSLNESYYHWYPPTCASTTILCSGGSSSNSSTAAKSNIEWEAARSCVQVHGVHGRNVRGAEKIWDIYRHVMGHLFRTFEISNYLYIALKLSLNYSRITLHRSPLNISDYLTFFLKSLQTIVPLLVAPLQLAPRTRSAHLTCSLSTCQLSCLFACLLALRVCLCMLLLCKHVHDIGQESELRCIRERHEEHKRWARKTNFSPHHLEIFHPSRVAAPQLGGL